MKRILALLLTLCLLPLCAAASRERVTSFTEEDAALVSAQFDHLLEMTIPGKPYPACCQSMTETERLLYAVILYDSYMRSSGLCSFLLDDPAIAADVPAALRMIGAQEQAELLEAFLAAHNPSGNPLFAAAGFINRNWAKTMYPFDSFDESMLAMDAKTALVTQIAAFLRAQ